MADGEVPRFGTSEWDAALTQRRSHAQGPHMRPAEPDEAMRAYVDASRDTRLLDALMDRLQVGASPPTPPAKPVEIGKSVGIIISALALAVTVGTSAVAVVQSNTRLYDKVETIDGRLLIVEKRQGENVPKLEESIRENKNQSDTINALREAMADERKQRADDNIANRSAFDRFMALLAAVKDKVADLDKALAVMQGPAHRSNLLLDTDRDVQAGPSR